MRLESIRGVESGGWQEEWDARRSEESWAWGWGVPPSSTLYSPPCTFQHAPKLQEASKRRWAEDLRLHKPCTHSTTHLASNTSQSKKESYSQNLICMWANPWAHGTRISISLHRSRCPPDCQHPSSNDIEEQKKEVCPCVYTLPILTQFARSAHLRRVGEARFQPFIGRLQEPEIRPRRFRGFTSPLLGSS